jgi:hypothetical protein
VFGIKTESGRAMAGLALAAILVLSVALVFTPSSAAISAGDVSNANSAIQSAFVLTYQAERNGGNVTSLVTALNSAVQLVEKAQGENSTDPSQAASDLQTARQMAQNVIAESAGVSAAGSSLRQSVFVRSVVSTAAILLAAALVYIFGGRAFRWLWVRMYGGYVVRPANG